MSKDDNKNTIIILLTVIIVILAIIIFLITTGTINLSNSRTVKKTDDNKQNASSEISDIDAIKIGKELYEKATEAYELWNTRPYCGISSEEINEKPTIELDDASIGKCEYYDSGYKNLEDLKNDLQKYFSKEIIDSKITKQAITDTALLKNISYNDYVETDGKLYCRKFSGKGFLSRYSGEYEIKTKNVEEDKITYTVILKQVLENSSSDCWNSLQSNNVDKSCSQNEIEYKDTTFEIKKIDDNWVVSDYTLHD